MFTGHCCPSPYVYIVNLIHLKTLTPIVICTGDVFAVIAPLDNNKNVKYYSMPCTEEKIKLLEEYNDNRFTYEWGSIILKGYLLQQNHMTQNYVYFQDYESDVICCRYSHLVCASRIKLVQVPLKKNLKNRKWKLSKYDHEWIIEDHIPLWSF